MWWDTHEASKPSPLAPFFFFYQIQAAAGGCWEVPGSATSSGTVLQLNLACSTLNDGSILNTTPNTGISTAGDSKQYFYFQKVAGSTTQ